MSDQNASHEVPNPNGLKPTAGKAWRLPREEGFVITLPSGNAARLRPVALDVLITSGKLPDMLTGIAAQTLWSGKDPEDIAEQADMAKGYADLVNAIIPAAFMEPKVVADPQEDDEIALDDIDFADKVMAFNLVTQPVGVLHKFRQRQAANVAAAPDGQNVRTATKRARRD